LSFQPVIVITSSHLVREKEESKKQKVK